MGKNLKRRKNIRKKERREKNITKSHVSFIERCAERVRKNSYEKCLNIIQKMLGGYNEKENQKKTNQ